VVEVLMVMEWWWQERKAEEGEAKANWGALLHAGVGP